MIKVEKIRANHKPLKGDARYRVLEGKEILFSWSAVSDRENDAQSACRVTVYMEQTLLWDSGWVEQTRQALLYGGAKLPPEERLTVSVAVRGKGGESPTREEYFYVSALCEASPDWITAPVDKKESVLYFKKEFDISQKLRLATAYVSGIGYHALALNGVSPDESLLEPPVSDFTKRVYFVMHPEVQSLLKVGKNVITVKVAEGWRRNEGKYLEAIGDRVVDFFGQPQLSFLLHLVYEDGSEETVTVDESWMVGHGSVTQSNVFNGEVYDANALCADWDAVGVIPTGFTRAVKASETSEVCRTSTMEPIRPQELYRPKSILPIGDGRVLVDFGQNIAGTVRLRLPQSMKKGDRVTLFYGEILENDGTISKATLREAACIDTYIASGDGRDLSVWQPQFTYHGFRYVEVTGLPLLSSSDITAVSFYNDIALESDFSCGSATVNAIQRLIVQTEKANLHNILTDCPQRDERMGWMNDATVRFEETPYNFDIGAIFPKIVTDLVDTQDAEGAITCTAPRIYGERPADPVCSSFLLAALQAYRYTGNKQVLEENYPYFVRWQECLQDHAEGDIVQYSHYGDWAAPVYACVGGDRSIDATQNLYTPGIFMSTGYYYYNAKLLSSFAEILGKDAEAKQYAEMAERIKNAMLAKWWDGESGKMATGSQGCQAFSLWLGILPEDKRALAARVLYEDLVARSYKFTTGNLCTRYLFDVLTEYGYVDAAWKLMTSEEYPSYGYMLQNGATTVWERFELKREPAMNSHCHPMYGAVGYWLYAYIAGIKFEGAACERAIIQPYFPSELLSASARVETVKGTLSVYWRKQWGELSLVVSVPFGMTAEVYFDGKTATVGSGITVLRRAL